MSKIICETAEKAKWEKFYWYKAAVVEDSTEISDHFHWRENVSFKVPLLPTHSLFSVDVLAPSRSSLQQKGSTEVPLSQPWAEPASQPHKRAATTEAQIYLVEHA